MDKYFYAVLKNLNDENWSQGSFDLQEAERMLKERYPKHGRIAVISAGYDKDGNATKEPVCVHMMSVKDLFTDDLEETLYRSEINLTRHTIK